MNKKIIQLPQQKWGTIRSKYQPESNYVQLDDFTAGSSNFITNISGAIEKITSSLTQTSALSAPGKDQYEAIFTSGIHQLLLTDNGTLKYMLADNSLTTIQTGFTATASMEYAMYLDRVYMDNGVQPAGVYDLNTTYGGVTYTLPQYKEMGAQPPAVAPTFYGADTSGGAVPDGGHTYKVTFLYYGFEESNGSPASALHTVVGSNQTVHLVIPTGGYGVTARNIYRDNNDGNWLLLDTISDNTTTAYVDTLVIGGLPTPIPQSNNLPPVFSQIVMNLSRMWVIDPTTPSTIYWSLAGEPDIFDPNNYLQCNPSDPMVALAAYQGITVVLNRHSLGQILGTTDDTFYYYPIPGTVGCVDNRTIQIRTIDGIPVLVFLSDRGFYAFNGSSVVYISDAIEDEVNLNLQQVNFVTGSNSQPVNGAFSGTSSPGIDLISNPGVMQTIVPQQIYQTEADWKGGVTLTNAKTEDGLNVLRNIDSFTPGVSDPTSALGGSAVISGSNVTLPQSTAWTGENHSASGSTNTGVSDFLQAQRIYIPRAGTLTGGYIRYDSTLGNSGTMAFQVWSDALGAVPGASLGVSANISVPIAGIFTYHFTGLSINIPAAGYYWIGMYTTQPTYTLPIILYPNPWSNVPSGEVYHSNGGTWHQAAWTNAAAYAFGYDFTYTPNTSSGTWTSATFDSLSESITALQVQAGSNSFPTNTNGALYIDTADALVGSTPDWYGATGYTYTCNNTGNTNISSWTFGRYYRFRWLISTNDDAFVPSVIAPALPDSTEAAWTSNVIDLTTDMTTYINLIAIQNGSNTIQLATSADGTSFPDGFVNFGTQVNRRYVKFQIALGGLGTGYSVTSLTFNWEIASVFQTSIIPGSIINTGATPAGWGLFEDSVALNGGGAAFYMRTSPTQSFSTAGSPSSMTTEGTLNTPRWLSVLVTLGNGKVLAIGGLNGSATSSCELYDPTTNLWTATGSLGTARYYHTAHLLANGKVIAIGGNGGIQSCELYDPVAGTWSSTGSMTYSRTQFSSVLLQNGKVLAIGGAPGPHVYCELYDPVAGTWSTTGALNSAREFHASVVLQNGNVLTTGGIISPATASCEIYNVGAGTWSTTGSMTTAREEHTLNLLQNGTAIAIGGSNGSSPLASCEIFNGSTWTLTGSLSTVIEDHQSLVLNDGTVLKIGGYSGSESSVCELFNGSTWTVTNALSVGRHDLAACLMANGDVLIAGGYSGTPSDVTDLYMPVQAPTSIPFTQVYNGIAPTVPLNQYIQWEVILTAIGSDVPEVNTVTINWFTGSSATVIRAASLFYNKTYYCAAAELGQSTNNIVIIWDQENNWRILRGSVQANGSFKVLGMNSLGLFFNIPYYLDATGPNVNQWLVAPNASSPYIALDARTKAMDFNDSDHLKQPRSVRVTGINTGTMIHTYYSVDRGVTWIELLNISGTSGYQTDMTGSKFNQLFVPDYSLGNITSGVVLMFRVTSPDQYPCKILTISPEIITRAGRYVGEAL